MADKKSSLAITTETLQKRQSMMWNWILALFIVLIVYGGRISHCSDAIHYVISPFLLLSVIIRFRKSLLRLPGEIYLYISLILWSSTGAFVAQNTDLFIHSFFMMIKVASLLLIIIVLLGQYGGMRYLLSSFSFGAALLLASGIITDGGQRLWEATSAIRYQGPTLNPNTFGQIMSLGIMGIIFLWNGKENTLLIRSFIIGIVLFLGFGMFSSGSRFAYLILLAFFTLLFIFCYYRKARKNVFIFFGIAGALFLFIILNQFILNKTMLGERLSSSDNVVNLVDDNRGHFYEEGLEMFVDHPIFGVGLGNFAELSSDGYGSHTDFLELLSTTGLIGLLLYLMIYLVLWKRIKLLERLSSSLESDYDIGYVKTIFFCLIIGGFVRPNFIDIFSMLFLGAIIGHTVYLKKKLQNDLVTPGI